MKEEAYQATYFFELLYMFVDIKSFVSKRKHSA